MILPRFMITILTVAAATACSTPSEQNRAEGADSASPSNLEGHVRFLADDLLEGRETGNRGYDIAANYVATRFGMYGLKPGGGDGTYYQYVPMLEPSKVSPDAGSLSFQNFPSVSLDDINHFVLPSSTSTDVVVEAPVVFVGYGIVSADEGRDDFAGLDIGGKIAMVLSGAPTYLNSEERAHYSATVAERLSERGAIGMIYCYTPIAERTMPFARLLGFLKQGTRMSWLKGDGTPYSRAPNLRAGAFVSMAGAEQILGAAGADIQEIWALSESEGGQVPAFETGLVARIQVESQHRRLSSPNVVGIIEGTDAKLAGEHVVLVAHLDHVGIKPVDSSGEDGIFNGAMDNAVGVSILLETARRLALAPPRRSVIFLATTAEERGMLGSDYFAENPTVAAESLVAVVNQDMPILTFDFQDVVAYGAERSNIYPVVEQAVARAGARLSPDPIPDEGIFTRSEQYSFVKRGVPGLSLKPGFANGGDTENKEFRSTHYHQVTDEFDLVDIDALEKFANTMFEISRGIADMDDRPVWRDGDFFARVFNGPMESAQDSN